MPPSNDTKLANILAIVKLAEDLAPTAVELIRALADRLRGASEAEVAAMAHAINQQVITDADKAIGGASAPGNES